MKMNQTEEKEKKTMEMNQTEEKEKKTMKMDRAEVAFVRFDEKDVIIASIGE